MSSLLWMDRIPPSLLFEHINHHELTKLLTCLNARAVQAHKGQPILLCGDNVVEMGMVLFGAAQIHKEDFNGNQHIIAQIKPGDLFAETFVCSGFKKSPVTVTALVSCGVLWIDYRKMISICPSACEIHTRLIQNMIKILSNKNFILNQKIDILSKRSVREKIMAYFSMKIQEEGDVIFKIDFTRQELADFLGVDRSALSRELGRMREEGLLIFQRNHFELIKNKIQ